jgi:nicotinamidase-related amidase
MTQKTALLLVDIQNDYFEGGKMPLVGMAEAAEKASRLLSLFRKKELPVYFVRHVSPDDASFLIRGSRGAKLHTAIDPGESVQAVEKRFPNSFRQTLLLEHLHQAQVGRLVICGAMSHMCIDATVRAAADFGFGCVVVQDACATRDLSYKDRKVSAEDVHAVFMAALAAAYAEVVDFEEFEKRQEELLEVP